MKPKFNRSELFAILLTAVLAATGCKSSNQSRCMMGGPGWTSGVGGADQKQGSHDTATVRWRN